MKADAYGLLCGCKQMKVNAYRLLSVCKQIGADSDGFFFRFTSAPICLNPSFRRKLRGIDD